MHFEQEKTTATEAYESALESWEARPRRQPLLSTEAQLGLRGEIATLRALMTSSGNAAVEMWTAYDKAVPGRHDFRLQHHEVEVKSTRQRQRVHRFNGLGLLAQALLRHSTSLQFEQGGSTSGTSLAEGSSGRTGSLEARR